MSTATTREVKYCVKCGAKCTDVSTVDQRLNKCWECGIRWMDDPDDPSYGRTPLNESEDAQ